MGYDCPVCGSYSPGQNGDPCDGQCTWLDRNLTKEQITAMQKYLREEREARAKRDAENRRLSDLHQLKLLKEKYPNAN